MTSEQKLQNTVFMEDEYQVDTSNIKSIDDAGEPVTINSYENDDTLFVSNEKIKRIQYQRREPAVQKILEFLEYLKIELYTILPQIEEAALAANAQHQNDDRRLAKAKKKLKKVITNTKEDLLR